MENKDMSIPVPFPVLPLAQQPPFLSFPSHPWPSSQPI